MKKILLFIIFFAACFAVFSEPLSEDELERLRGSVKIGSVNDDTVRGDDGAKSELIKFFTYQYEDEVYPFRIRVTVELEDKNDERYFAQMARAQGPLHDEYTGEDNWEFQVPHGDLERPKISAYSVQYGILNDGEFIVLAEETDDVDTASEITDRTTNRIDIQSTYHSYSYRDGDAILQSQSN